MTRKTLAFALLASTALTTPSLAATLPDNPTWTKTVVSAGVDQTTMVCTDNAGATIVGGYRTSGNLAFTAKYDVNGTLLWNKSAPATEIPTDCVTDSANNIYSVDKTYIKRRSPTGTLVWRSQAVPGQGGTMTYENIAGVTSGALWVSGTYVDGCMLAGGPCPPDYTQGGAVMKVAASNGVRVFTSKPIKNDRNENIPDIATNRYGDLFVINGTYRQVSGWEDGWQPAGWPVTCQTPNFVSKWLANGSPAARVCFDNTMSPGKLAAGFDTDPVVFGTGYAGHMGVAIRARKLNHLTLATLWQRDLPTQTGSSYVVSLAADRWTGQSILASYGTGYGGMTPPTSNVVSLSGSGAISWQRQPTRYADPLVAVPSTGAAMTYGVTPASDATLSRYAR